MRIVAAAFLALVIVTSGCDVVQDADELAGTTWIVIAVDDEDVPAGEVLLWLDADTATLITQPQLGIRTAPFKRRCAESESSISMDTDGHALEFSPFTEDEGGPFCDPGMAELHDRIAEALHGTETWEATSGALELVGISRVRLESAGSD